MNSREQTNSAKITILLELYNRDYIDSFHLDTMGGFTFDKYEVFEDMQNKKELFYFSFLELQDLGLVASKNSVGKSLGVIEPRLTGKAFELLDNIFLEHSFQNFISNGFKKEGKMKDIVVDKTIENVVEKAIGYILSSKEPLYNLLLQGLNNLPI